MSCSELWTNVSQSGVESLAGHPHLSECPACAARYARYQRLTAGLRALASDMRETGAPPRVEATLLAAMRAGKKAPVRARVLPFGLRPAWALAAAAGIVLAAGLTLIPKKVATPAAHHRQATKVELAALDDSAADAPVLDEGFIPLPNAERLEPGDDVNVVRMELPRSSMIAVGYDISADHAAEMVEADVALGPDGLARAVKFLDNASL